MIFQRFNQNKHNIKIENPVQIGMSCVLRGEGRLLSSFVERGKANFYNNWKDKMDFFPKHNDDLPSQPTFPKAIVLCGHEQKQHLRQS